MKTFSLGGPYYYTKDGPDEWTVHGRRAHLRITRTDGPTGREDRRGEDILQDIFIVSIPYGFHSKVIDLDDQFSSHGYENMTTLKQALSYSLGKLKEYDDRVDPIRRKENPMSNRAGRYLLIVIAGGFIETVKVFVDAKSAKEAANGYTGRLNRGNLDDAIVWDALKDKFVYAAPYN